METRRSLTWPSTVLMSHPFGGSPAMPFDTFRHPPSPAPPKPDIHAALAALDPPRKHYKWYYSTAPASAEMSAPAAGLHAFLRGYFHLKSADWAGNAPVPLSSWSAPELAKMPGYYVMPLHLSMADTVAADMSLEDADAVKERSSRWQPDAELAVYVQEFGRNSFQGGLNYYRVATDPRYMSDLAVFAGKKIEVPALFVAGSQDWGTYQVPGAVEKMSEACTDFRGVRFVQGAGHWVMQEQPDKVVQLILEFLG
jgi:pimeloyl-ACP methyl ester carboxylesterase